MQTKAIDNIYRSSIVSVDSYDNKILTGRLCNPSFEGTAEFSSFIEFILLTEKMLNDMQFPQPFSEVRSFSTEPKVTLPTNSCTSFQNGRLATLELKILFRQNTSWQGSLMWVEGNREESFRSVLELAMLIDSAMVQINR